MLIRGEMTAAIAYLELEGEEAIGRGIGEDDALELAVEGGVLPSGLERDEEFLGATGRPTPQCPSESRRHRDGAVDVGHEIGLLRIGADRPLIDEGQVEDVFDAKAHIIAVALGPDGEELDALAALIVEDGGLDEDAALSSVKRVASVGEEYLEFIENGLGMDAALGKHHSSRVYGTVEDEIYACRGIAAAYGIQKTGYAVNSSGERQAKGIALLAQEKEGRDKTAFARRIRAVKQTYPRCVKFCPF